MVIRLYNHSMQMTILAARMRGDTQPYVALRKGLRHAGYDVRMTVFSKYAEMVRREGLVYFPVHGDITKATETCQSIQ